MRHVGCSRLDVGSLRTNHGLAGFAFFAAADWIPT
jgi:hypothetical protein